MVVWGAAAALGRPGLALAGVAWHLSLAVMVDWHLGMLERRDGSALEGLGRANAITLVRAAAIPALFALDESGLLLGLVVLAGLDVLDGVVARRLDERTRLGAWLDGSTDTLVGLAVALAAFRLAVVPGLLVALVLLRVGVPWILLLRAYFLTPCPFAMEGGLRDEGLATRVPGIVAAVGVGLALAGTEIGVPLAILGVSASIGQAARGGRRRAARGRVGAVVRHQGFGGWGTRWRCSKDGAASSTSRRSRSTRRRVS